MSTKPRHRPRGRPPGGGLTAEQARRALMDAAESSFVSRGYRASTMEAIARDAGYSRAGIYRQFPNRRSLLDALVERATQRHLSSIVDRLPDDAGPIELIVESLVIVATELVDDPVLRTVSQQSDEGSIAYLVSRSQGLAEIVAPLVEALMSIDVGGAFRPGVDPRDVGRFLITTCMGLLQQIHPDIRDPDSARRYLNTFVVPAIAAEPPPPVSITDGAAGGREPERTN